MATDRASSKSLKQPCIKYKSSFEHNKLEQVTLVQTYQDSTKKKKCPVFTGEFGIEQLLYVEERFRKVCRQLDYTTADELFDSFEEVVMNNAEDKWENVTSRIQNNQRTVPIFNQVIQQYYLHYCDHEARDAMFEYVRQIQKPFQSEASEHSDRMETLIRYANKLPGNEPPLNDQQKKSIIFKSFPLKWQQAYVRSGRRIAQDTLTDIVQYMKDEKGFSDLASEQNKRKREMNDNQGRSHGRGSSGRGHGRGRGRGRHNDHRDASDQGNNNMCWKHNYQHAWSECWDNPNGRNYMPNRRQGRGRGQNSGRGGPGRGFNRYQGNHDNRSRQNSQYHNNNNHNRNANYGENHSNHLTTASQLTTNSGSEGSKTSSAREAPPMEHHHIDFISSNECGSASSTGGHSYGGRRY